jgi:hypothetical protein
MSSVILQALLAVTVLAAPPVVPLSAGSSGPFETVLSEQVIGALLSASAPFDETMEQEIGILGISKTVTLSIHLSEPKVKVSPDGVHVTMNYHVTDDSGVLDQSGVAMPLLQITPVPAKQTLEARLTHSGVVLPGGIELPVESLVDPIEIPAVMMEDVDLGSKVLVAEVHAREVINEEGHVRIRGDVTFRPKAVAKAASAAPAPTAKPAAPAAKPAATSAKPAAPKH